MFYSIPRGFAIIYPVNGGNDELTLKYEPVGGSVPGSGMESHEGTVERVIFQNPENGYAVVRFTPFEGQEFVIIGSFLNLSEGMLLTVKGRWVTHPRFGRQFNVEEYDASMPKTIVGIRKYLASFIKGVGPVMAKRIVDHFGEESVEIIDRDPKRLREVPGIGASKAKMIEQSWEKYRKIKSVMMFLQSHNVGPGTAMKIYNMYGDASVQMLKDNPYILAREISGIGFKIADRIAMSIGIEKDSPVRLEAGLEYTMETAANEGHTFLPEVELVRVSSEILECSEEKVEQLLQALMDREDRLIRDDGKIYSPPLHFSECKVAERLAKLAGDKRAGMSGIAYTQNDIQGIEKQLGFRLSNQQTSVLDVMAQEKVAILTGGPGTGKTSSIRAVIRLFKKSGYHVELAAPTGRAAKRMTEATGFPARTIHRLLEFNPKPPGSFGRNVDNPLEADLVVIDEVSMIDITLMHYLTRAIKSGTRLLLVGDVDQLPSVGPGNVLRDLIDSGCIATVRLQTVYRQEAESTIIGNAHLINRGEMPVMSSDRRGNFFFSQKESPEEAADAIVRLCTERLGKFYNIDPQKDVQVISPMYKGVLGVDNLNVLLREALNPGRDINCGSRQFRLGDRIMQTRNNYDKEVFNGDVGFIRAIDLEESTVDVEYPEHVVKYGFDELDEVVPAYAITVHKSQGSEYPVVIMPASTLHYVMLQRNLLYTAITRASKLVVLVGTRKALAIAVKNNKIEERYTSLAERLRREMNKRTLFNGPGMEE